MKIALLSFVAAIAFVIFENPAHCLGYDTQAIYGSDDRYDYFEIRSTPLLALAESSAVLIPKANIRQENGHWVISAKTLEEEKKLCPTERFLSQETPGFCTATLVGPDLLLTAGHCFENEAKCKDTKFVFGFAKFTPEHNTAIAQKENVFSCKELVFFRNPDAKNKSKSVDFALVRLDREAQRPVVPLVRTKGLSAGDQVITMGYPTGMPLKFSLNAYVRRKKKFVVETNLDVYGGNSGSPVFEENSLHLEGIVTEGEDDFVPHKGCHVSKHCTDEGCSGEDALTVNTILDELEKAKFQL